LLSYDAKILATATAVKSELADDVSAFSEFIESVESFIDGTGVVQFFDSGLEVIHGVIDTVNDIQVAILEASSEITRRVNQVQRTITAIKNIKNFPSQFVDLVTDTFGSFASLKNFTVVRAFISSRNVTLFAIHAARWSFSSLSRSIPDITLRST
jgi:hypothetical protein